MSGREGLIDITIALRAGVPEWPGDTPFTCGWTMTIANGASVNVSSVTSSPHVGTHADAPLHVREGWPGSHELPVEAFLGEAVVLDVSDAANDDELTAERLVAAAGALGAAEERIAPRVLLKTGRSIADGIFPDAWPALTEEAARALVANGVRLIGVDAPSVDSRESKTLAVHQMLFSANACILENLDLRRVKPGRYELIALPLRLMGLDAAPVRAVLRTLESDAP